jgi:hypothetical protein
MPGWINGMTAVDSRSGRRVDQSNKSLKTNTKEQQLVDRVEGLVVGILCGNGRETPKGQAEQCNRWAIGAPLFGAKNDQMEKGTSDQQKPRKSFESESNRGDSRGTRETRALARGVPGASFTTQLSGRMWLAPTGTCTAFDDIPAELLIWSI